MRKCTNNYLYRSIITKRHINWLRGVVLCQVADEGPEDHGSEEEEHADVVGQLDPALPLRPIQLSAVHDGGRVVDAY